MTSTLPTTLHLGGHLNFSIIHAEKNSGSGLVFSHGPSTSRVEVFCGSKYLAQSVINTGLGRLVGERKEKKYEWVSFDSTFRDIIVTPDCPPLVRIIIYDCDRSEENKPLGEVHLDLQSMVNVEDRLLDLPILSYSQDTSATPVGTIKLNVSFIQFPLNMVTVGNSYTLDCSRMNKLVFAVGYETPPSRRSVPGAVFSTALVMFDSQGNYVDSVDIHKLESTQGALCRYETIVPLEGYRSDQASVFLSLVDTDKRAAPISSIFLVLLARTDFSSLQELENIYFRVQDGRSRKELYRFNMDDIVTPASSLILARFARHPSARMKVGAIHVS